MSWYKDVAMYGHHGDNIDAEDDDLNVLPLIVEKILVPKLIGKSIFDFVFLTVDRGT